MTKSSWERFLGISELAVCVGGIVVVAGLVLESHWIEEALHDVGESLVIAGVAIETLTNAGLILAARKLQAIHERELESMRLETAQANARAAEASLALEKLKTPRTLTLEQREPITHAMRAYSGQAFAIYAAPDPEAAELAVMIRAALINAQERWKLGFYPCRRYRSCRGQRSGN